MRRDAAKLGIAVLVSALAHALVVTGGWIGLPAELPDPAPMAVTIAPSPLLEPAPAVTPPATPRVQRRATPKPASTAAQPVVVARAPGNTVPDLPAMSPFPGDAVTVGTGTAPEPAPQLAPAPPPERVAIAPVTTLPAEPEPLRSLPRRGRIVYNLYFGMDRFSVGRTVQTWEVSGTRYRLESVSETTGIVDLFRSEKRVYASRGSITPAGLKPDEFSTERVRRGQSESARAMFAWNDGHLRFGDNNAMREAPMPRGAQDIVSFMYQVGLNPPPPGRLKLAITNGSKFEEYELDVLPEESIDTPIGRLKALPLVQVRRPNSESIQIWLAVEYRHLPVKIRFIDRQGQPSGEQVVSEISVSEDQS